MAAERLADDLLVEILSRVPARSVYRFRCVSKHWLGLIDHPDHRRKLPQTLAGFFYTRSDNGELPLETEVCFASVSGNRCRPPIDTSFAFLPSHRRVDLLDCCNGLLLCRLYGVSAPDDEFGYVVCSPATEEWVALPSPDTGHPGNVRTLYLGFDPAMSSNFYVFALLLPGDVHSMFYFYPAGVDLYSSETRRWVYKEIEWDKRIVLPRPPAVVFLNGCFHFNSWPSSRIAVVDTEGETWTTFHIPSHLYDGSIQRSQGCLHYVKFKRGNKDGDAARLEVYVLEDYDSKEWTLKHMHTVETSDIFGRTIHPVDSRWIAIHPECNLIFFTAGSVSTLMCYDMDHRQVKVIRNLDGYQPRLPYVPLYAELQSLHA